MTIRKILVPVSNVDKINNIFNGRDVTPAVAAVPAKSAWITPLNLALTGMRITPELNLSPPDATGFKTQWMWNGNNINISADGFLYLPATPGIYSQGLQVKILNPDASIIISPEMPLTVKNMTVVNEDPLGKVTSKEPIFLKPVIGGYDDSFPVDGLQVTFTPQDTSQARIDDGYKLTLLEDVDQVVNITVTAIYNAARYSGTWSLNQVAYVPLTSISLPAVEDKRLGDTFTVQATLNPENSTDDAVLWSWTPRENLTLVSTDDKKHTATFAARLISDTVTKITVVSVGQPGISATTNISKIMEQLIPVAAVSITPSSLSGLRVGDSVTLQASIVPENASEQDGEWYVDDPTVVDLSTNGKTAIIKMLVAGSGTDVHFRSSEGSKIGTVSTGQILPKPTPPAAIDMTTETLDPRVTYTGGNVPYFDAANNLKWSAGDVWPTQYLNGVLIGRTLPELANVNRVKKTHFEEASLNTQPGSDGWVYTSGIPITWGATDGIDGGMAAGVPLWYNASRVVQDDVVIRPLTSSFDGFYNTVTKGGLLWQRGVLRFAVPEVPQTETRMDLVTSPQSTANQLGYTYKELEPGSYNLSFFRRRNTSGDKWVFCLPQINKGDYAVGPLFGTQVVDAIAMVQSNRDVQTLRLYLYKVSDGSTTIRDIPTGGAEQVRVNASGTANWYEFILKRIEYIIP